MQRLNLVVEDAPPAGVFAVKKVSVEFNFVKSGSDSLTISGTIPLPAGFGPFQRRIIRAPHALNGPPRIRTCRLEISARGFCPVALN